MATGEKTFSTAGRTVTTGLPPFPQGDYELKLRKSEVRCKDEPGAIPYVSVQAEVLGTAATEGGKNRVVFFNLFMSLVPGKDGIVAPERGSGLVALARALDTELEDLNVIERDFDGQHQEFLDARAVATWLQTLEGAVCRARIRISKAQNGFEPRNEVDRFLPAS